MPKNNIVTCSNIGESIAMNAMLERTAAMAIAIILAVKGFVKIFSFFKAIELKKTAIGAIMKKIAAVIECAGSMFSGNNPTPINPIPEIIPETIPITL